MTRLAIVPKRREPNGRLSRAIDMQNEDNAQKAREAQSVVLSQPHRQGSSDPLCESALGRFVLKHGLPRELFEAGILYASMRRMWLGGCWRAPIDERHSGSGGEISEELARKLRDDSRDWLMAMKEAGGIDGAMAVQCMADGYEAAPKILTFRLASVVASLFALGKISGKL